MAKGIIFDFNGTMVFDAHLHEKAWVEMIQKHNDLVTEQEVIDYIHGRTNDQIIHHFIGEAKDEELQALSDEKEKEYQRLAREEQLGYVDGTEELLDQLITKKIPFTIATASPKINIDFYFDYFKLDRWFTPEEIVYDDGTFPGKPHPTIYQKAAEKLGLAPKDCIVIEDATAGVQAANRANIGQVFVMVYAEEQRDLFNPEDYTYEAMVENFNGFLEKYL